MSLQQKQINLIRTFIGFKKKFKFKISFQNVLTQFDITIHLLYLKICQWSKEINFESSF